MTDTDRVLSNFTQTVREDREYAKEKLRIGIIGTGWIAEAHTESYLKQPDVEIVTMADQPGKAEKFAEYTHHRVNFCRTTSIEREWMPSASAQQHRRFLHH